MPAPETSVLPTTGVSAQGTSVRSEASGEEKSKPYTSKLS